MNQAGGDQVQDGQSGGELFNAIPFRSLATLRLRRRQRVGPLLKTTDAKASVKLEFSISTQRVTA